MYINCSTSQ